MKRVLQAVLLLMVFLAAGFAVRSWGVGTVRIAGTSMNETLQHGDVVLITKFDYTFGGMPERGDIVECRFPNRSDTYVKRVIGLPGDSIEYRDGTLTVNGRPVSEPYVSSETRDFSAIIDDDAYLVMGDNRNESYDSRAADMGPIDREAFLGKARWIIWPLNRFGPVD